MFSKGFFVKVIKNQDFVEKGKIKILPDLQYMYVSHYSLTWWLVCSKQVS